MANLGDPDKLASKGQVYLVGAGPGDPGLITVKGLEKIRSADVIIYDYLAVPELLDYARPDAELIYVGKKGKDHTREQPEINDLLVKKAREGKTIVRLKGGDPYVFGRGGEEAEELYRAGIAFEIVPGVTSAIAAPAYAGIPVTHRDHASVVTFITGHEDPTKEESAIDWEVLARSPGTLVFLMGVKNLSKISESLIQHGKAKDTPAALVRWGTTPEQVTAFAPLSKMPEEAKLKGIQAPAILVVGSVVELHRSLGWFEKKPLFGKRILITRGKKQAHKMSEKVLEQGGNPILFPTIQIQPPADLAPLDKAIREIKTYDWVIFTSVNGVEKFFERFFKISKDIRELAGPKIGAIGPITAASLSKLGLKVELVAKEFMAEGVLDLLSEQEVRGKRFLIPRAEKARELLPEGIRAMGGYVEIVTVYRTGLPESSAVEEVVSRISAKEVDAITFTSSSTVNHFIEMLKGYNLDNLLSGVVMASIGPITSQALKENNLPVTVEARVYTIDGLVDALISYFKR